MSKRNTFWLIVIILVVLSSSGKLNFFKQSIIGDTQTQLASEYNTYWANRLDGDIPQPIQYSGENDKFSWTASRCPGRTDWCPTEITGDGEAISVFYSLTTKKDFYGQEVVVLMRMISPSSHINGISVDTIGAEGIYLFKFVPRTLDNSKVDVFYNGRLFQTITVQKPFYLHFDGGGDINGRLIIDFIGYKAQFSCDLSADEVWVHPDYVAGETFSINDLDFVPTKFCKETRPFVLINIQQGETVIVPNPIPDFNRGKSLTVPEGSTITAPYATYYVAGVNNKCNVNQGNKCEQRDISTKKCLRWICQDVIKPIEIVVQCKVDSDCPQPLKNICPSYFTGCKENKCTYDDTILNAPQCKNEVVTIIKQVQQLDQRVFLNISSQTTFSFTENENKRSFKIGNVEFSSKTSSSCGIPSDVDIVRPPQPAISCYKATAFYDGRKYEIQDSQTIILTPNIKLIYFVGGEIKRTDGGIVDKLSGQYYFTITDPLTVEVLGGSEVIKDSPKEVELELENNLPDGIITLKVQQRVKTTSINMPEQIMEFNVKNGKNKIKFNMNTANLGVNQFTIQIFYKIKADAEVLLPSNKFLFNYVVVNKISNINPPIVVLEDTSAAPIITSTQTPPTKKVVSTTGILIGVGIGILIFLRLAGLI